MRTYKVTLERARGGMSPEAIHRSKCSAKKARHAAAKAENIERMKTRPVRSPEEQLALLDRRLGKGIGAMRERTQLSKRITAAKTKAATPSKAKEDKMPKSEKKYSKPKKDAKRDRAKS